MEFSCYFCCSKYFKHAPICQLILSGELLNSTEFQSHFHMSVSRHFSCSFLTFLNSTGASDSKPTALKHGIFNWWYFISYSDTMFKTLVALKDIIIWPSEIERE